MGKRQWAGVAVFLAGSLLGVSGAQAGGASVPLTFTKSYGAASVPVNGSTSLTFSIENTNPAYDASGVTFTDSLPAGLLVSSPNGLVNTCLGTTTAVAGSSTVQLSGGAVALGATCSLVVNVTGTSAGLKTSTTPAVTATGFPLSSGATASLQVLAAVASAASIPTLSEWGLILLVLAMAVSAFKAVRRQR